jgi:capsular polysaccharide export protein
MKPIRGSQRVFLFLQGPASPFFARLGAALVQAGHGVRRINFCGGDRVFWPAKLSAGTVDFCAAAPEWPSFLQGEMHRHGVTDVLLFGDRRPFHATAIAMAERLGIAAWSFEEGYLRPDWITLELGGNNGCSPLPRDPQEIRDRAEELPEPPPPRPVSASRHRMMVARQLVYEAANLAWRTRFSHWQTHRPYPALAELRGWARRIPTLPLRHRRAEAVVRTVLGGQHGRFFLYPLQIDSDFQLRAHSRFGGLVPAVRAVLASFGAHAPEGTSLVVKNHPLDNGILDAKELVTSTAAALGIGNRVIFLDGGHLPTLLSRCTGVVTVNSTVGLSALGHGRGVKALGTAIYDVPGLTFQGALETFWREPSRPDPSLFRAFRRLIIAESQLNGSFHTREGVFLAVEGAMRRLGVRASLHQSSERDVGRPDSASLPHGCGLPGSESRKGVVAA